jgi:hypothetical protein
MEYEELDELLDVFDVDCEQALLINNKLNTDIKIEFLIILVLNDYGTNIE